MKYEQANSLSDEQLRRLTRVKRSTFNRMIQILKEEDKKKKPKVQKKQAEYGKSAINSAWIY